MSHVVLVASGMVLMFLVESLFWPGRGLARQNGAHVSQGRNPSPASPAVPPWGRIEYQPIALDRPEEYFTNEVIEGANTVWSFRNHTEQQLDAYFSSLNPGSATLSQLTSRTNWKILPRTILVAPPPETVVSLQPETRKQLYSMLARNPENVPQARPFRFRLDGFNDWLAECGLPNEKVELVRKLTYVDGNSLCFADAPAFSRLASPAETKLLVKCLWRVSTFVMKLHVDPSTDVDALMKYWGGFGADKTYRPLIESMSRVPGGSSINISYFFPPFARLRLYTYPDPRDPNIVREDCFWSAMNFFNAAPDHGYFNPEYTKKVLSSDYAKVLDASKRFGDILMLLGHDGQALHMCVYVADDVVFTKNGANTQQPWVLMRISEMLAEYEKDKPFQIVTYRRKTPPVLGFAGQFSSAKHSL